MDGLWEKISSYNLFNNLFPGALFIYLLERSTSVVLSTEDIVKNIVLYYFVGLVIGRVGSIVVEPILKAVRVIRFTPYSDYISACKKD
ncbi:phosphohistidine phosphatase, partial [Klebsiella pneumoniae]|nr:phosphohistidine phosphatase [Klebsiella pneumoniae]